METTSASNCKSETGSNPPFLTILVIYGQKRRTRIVYRAFLFGARYPDMGENGIQSTYLAKLEVGF